MTTLWKKEREKKKQSNKKSNVNYTETDITNPFCKKKFEKAAIMGTL